MSSIAEIQEQRTINTLFKFKETWKKHSALNKVRIKRWVQTLWKDSNTKTGVLIAAGPSLSESIDEIKSLDRDKHEIIVVDMALSFLVDNGIIPDFVICSDASEKIAESLMEDVPDHIPLLLNTIVHPETGSQWLGPIYWYVMSSNVYDGDITEWMERSHKAASSVPSTLVPGGNVSSLGLSFLLGVRAAPKVLLYGHDFCWTDEREFYCGGVRGDLAAERIKSESEDGTVFAMKETKGIRDVRTNASLVEFARWFSERMGEFPGVIENRTPTTILSNGGRKI